MIFPGPQPDWDPEITEALDHMEGGNTSECSDELEDDFVLQVSLTVSRDLRLYYHLSHRLMEGSPEYQCTVKEKKKKEKKKKSTSECTVNVNV